MTLASLFYEKLSRHGVTMVAGVFAVLALTGLLFAGIWAVVNFVGCWA